MARAEWLRAPFLGSGLPPRWRFSSPRALTRGTGLLGGGHVPGDRRAGAGRVHGELGFGGKGRREYGRDCYVPPSRGERVTVTGKDTTTELKPVSEKNIAAYGLPPIAWERAVESAGGMEAAGAAGDGRRAGAAYPLAGHHAPGRQAACRTNRGRLARQSLLLQFRRRHAQVQEPRAKSELRDHAGREGPRPCPRR